MFDFVVVDTSGVFDDHALAALDRSATIILVGTLDIPALKGLKLATGTLDLLNFPRDSWKLRAQPGRRQGRPHAADEFESTLGLKADHSLVSSREVLAAVNRGEATRARLPRPRQQQGPQRASPHPGRVARRRRSPPRPPPAASPPVPPPPEEGLT